MTVLIYRLQNKLHDYLKTNDEEVQVPNAVSSVTYSDKNRIKRTCCPFKWPFLYNTKICNDNQHDG